MAPAPGVVTGRYGTIGKVFLVEQDYWPLNTTLFVKDFQGNNPTFVFHLLKTIDYRTHSGKSGVPGVNRNDLHEIELSVPSEEAEQRAIAEALTDADGLIESLEQLLAKKRDVKQGAMQQLLTGKTRLLGFEGEWTEKYIEQLADIRSGGTPSTTTLSFWGGGIPWTTPTDITALEGHKYLIKTARTITKSGLSSSSAELIPARSVIMTTRATIGECAINLVPMTTNQGFKNLIPRDGIDVEFLYYLMLTQRDAMIQLCGGSTFLEIGKTQLRSLEVHVPTSLPEQTAIATVLSDIDAEITALEAKLAKARRIKQGMMQQLLTGRIRLVDRPAVPPARENTKKPHSWQFNEAVVIAVLSQNFGSEQYPLGRMRYTKLSYLLHRHAERQAEGYLKKAAGPYRPATRYGGPEKIALERGYAQKSKRGKYQGFVAGPDIDKANAYFEKWYGSAIVQWLEQFRFVKNEELELLATVAMAVAELRESGSPANVASVKGVLAGNKEWKPKLDRAVFADTRIASAIKKCSKLFPDATETTKGTP